MKYVSRTRGLPDLTRLRPALIAGLVAGAAIGGSAAVLAGAGRSDGLADGLADGLGNGLGNGLGDAARRADPSLVGIAATAADGRSERGAGFALGRDGMVVTAAHVVAGATSIRLRLPDGREAAATLVGADPLADVAVLKTGASLPAVTPGPLPARGDVVAALGDPLGYDATLTAGHVSTPRRLWDETNPYDVIQHDAALNPGSSGGPLLDADGRVVGLNVAIADGARRDVGIGLALPIGLVEQIAGRIVADPAARRPELGLRLRNTDTLRAAIPALTGGGAMIEAVASDSAAARAGLAAGQVVVAADGVPVRRIRDLARAMAEKRPGDGFSLTVMTGDDVRRISLPLEAPRARPGATQADDAPVRFGLELDAGEPPRVRSVAVDTASELAGLKAGDEILSVGLGRLEAADPGRALAEAVRMAGQGGIALLVKRGDETRWVLLGTHGRLDVSAPFGSNAEAPTSHSL